MGGSKDLRIRKIPKFTSYQGIHNKEDIGFRKSPLAPLLRQAQDGEPRRTICEIPRKAGPFVKPACR